MRKLAEVNPFLGNLFCSVVFLCWKGRNKLVHGGSEDTCSSIATNSIIQVVASFDSCLIRDNWDANQLYKLSQSSWHPPPPGWIKVNVDASVQSNQQGRHRGSLRRLQSFGCLHWDCSKVEFLAILVLRNYIHEWMFDAKGLVIEGDNGNVIKIFQNSMRKPILAEEFLKPKDLDFPSNFKQFIFSCSKRECNKLADLCANYALISSFFWDDISSNKIPPPFLDLLKEESG
ncbi:hypothetical protein IEQ34_011821 [Dendrobium chrysotoxum]|uniref:RNase H type-1 domain-containing protein n=1 Tax=Dendrobium chrysotoxum TaxID=161865 RepID=A0AAV7GS87_DENCH|nr:hypothetical protein IEQ34_011821 [Dendrobium chrysotoxum]